jgi:hypothetical protein
MAETGTKLEGNIKSLTLEQVFALNLQNFPVIKKNIKKKTKIILFKRNIIKN